MTHGSQLGRKSIYIASVTVLLVVGWLLVGDGSGFDAAAVVIAVVRGVELVGFALALLRVGSGGEFFVPEIETIPVYFVQMPLILAIASRVIAPHGFADSNGIPTGSPIDYLYLSWTNMTTLGSQYSPTTDPAKVLVIVSGASGILVIGVFLAYAISRISSAGDD